MIERRLTPRLLDALGDRPVTLLVGARQSGKSTLALAVAGGSHPARYLTFDDPPTLAAAAGDPVGFLDGLAGDVVLDEVQLVPELFRALKATVDRDRRSGRFLLTGSAQVLLLPRLSESLAGRMEVLMLWPLSESEARGVPGSFVDAVFGAGQLSSGAFAPVDAADLCRLIVVGGFPEVRTLRDAGRRGAWFASYVTTILQRDVRDIANVDGLVTMPALLALLAARSAGMLNVSELSRSAGVKLTTLNRYLALLETVFLVQRLPAWSANLGKRLVKAPKLHFVDTGLAAHLSGSTSVGWRRRRRSWAPSSRPSSSTSCRRRWGGRRPGRACSTSAAPTVVRSTSSSRTSPAGWSESRCGRARPRPGRTSPACVLCRRWPVTASCAVSSCTWGAPRCRSETGSRRSRSRASGLSGRACRRRSQGRTRNEHYAPRAEP